MKIVVEWEETWARSTTIEIDKEALLDWLDEGGYTLPTDPGPLEATLKEFLESDSERTNYSKGVLPGHLDGDEFCDLELTRVRPS